MRGLDTRIKTLEAEARKQAKIRGIAKPEYFIGGDDGFAYSMRDIRRALNGDFPHILPDGRTVSRRGLNPDFVYGKISLTEMAKQSGITPTFYIDDQPKNSLVWPEDQFKDYCLLQ